MRRDVVQIELPDNNLAGPLPPQIGNLTGLAWLYLQIN